MAPSNTVAPVVSTDGSPNTGETVSSSTGTWSGTPAPSFTYQWQRSTNGGSSWSNIGGATNSTYVLAAGDEGNLVRVRVTGSNTSGSATASSNSISPTAPVVSYASVVAADSPRAYFRLKDLTDSSGNGHALTAGGAGTISNASSLITDPADGAKHFDNSGTGFLSTADASDLRVTTGDFSVETWVKTPAAANFWLVTKVGDFKMGLLASGKFRFTINGSGGWFTDADSTTTFATNGVYHVVATWQNSTKLLKLYVNGALEATIDASTFGYTPTTSGWGALQLGANAALGSDGIAGGDLDECAIYQSVLSAARVSAHYAAGI